MSPESVRVTFRHLPVSSAVEARIREEATDLNQFYGRITSCHVIIDAPHQHHRPQGRTWQISIQFNIPGECIIVNHAPSLHARLGEEPEAPAHKHDEPNAGHRDIFVCIHDAFRAARRQLEEHSQKVRGDVKHHPDQTHHP